MRRAFPHPLAYTCFPAFPVKPVRLCPPTHWASRLALLQVGSMSEEPPE